MPLRSSPARRTDHESDEPTPDTGRSPSSQKRAAAARRVALALGAIVLSCMVPPAHWPLLGLLAVAAFVALTLSGVPFLAIVRRARVFLPLLLGVAFSMPLSQGLAAGWDVMAAILLRGTVSLLWAFWLIHAVPFDDFLWVLAGWRVSHVFLAMLLFMHRYCLVVWEEWQRMQRSREARSFGSRSLRRDWTAGGQIVAMLLIRSLDRADRVYAAMLSRGWDGQLRRWERDASRRKSVPA